jgi:hypothetical protein
VKGEWCYFKSYFCGADCQKIIDLAMPIPAKDATLGVAGSDETNNQHRRSKIRFLPNDAEWQFKQ